MVKIPKVVCRVAKISSMSKIGQAGSHNLRLESEANREHINDNSSYKNQILVGSNNLVSDVKARLETAEKNDNGKFRKNAVLAVEMILSASPEYFKNKKALDQWTKKNVDWLQKKYGENLVNVVLHLDEQTPHLHVFIVPIDHKNKLNCRAFFGGKDKMKLLQDESYLAVKELGIIRGIPKGETGATHKETTTWRAEQAAMDLEKTSFQKSIDKVPEIETGFTGLVKAKTADMYYKKRTIEAINKTYAPKLIEVTKQKRLLEKQNKILKESAEKLEQENKDARKRNFQLQQEVKSAHENGYQQRIDEETKQNRKKINELNQQKNQQKNQEVITEKKKNHTLNM
jgi:hypothetical protein